MRLRSLSTRGIGRPYRKPEPTTLDLDALGPGVIAIAGVNGSGKTMLLETLPAALYQRLPFREPRSIYDYASGRDCLAEAIFDDHGRTIRVTVRIDAEKRKTERTLTVEGEAPITGKAAFDARVRELFGSYEGFLATVFAPQSQKGNLCELPVAERKALFAEFIGAGRYAKQHAEAKARRDALDADLTAERRGIAAVEEEVSGLPWLENDFIEASIDAAGAELHLTETRDDERQAIEDSARAATVRERLSSLESAELTARGVMDRAVTLEAEAAKGPDLAKTRHAQRLKFIDARTADERCKPLYDAHAVAVQRLDARRIALEGQIAALPDGDQVKRNLELARVDLATIEAEDRAAQELRREVDKAAMELAAAQDALDVARTAREREVNRLRLQTTLLTDKDEEGLPKIPCTATDDWSRRATGAASALARNVGGIDLAGTCPLLSNARKARELLADLEKDPSLPEEARVIAAGSALEALAERQATEAVEGPARKARHGELRAQESTLSGDLARAEAGPRLHADLDAVKAERLEVDRKLEADLVDARAAALKASSDAAASAEALRVDLEEASAKFTAAHEAAEVARASHLKAADALEAARVEAAAVDLDAIACRMAETLAAREAAEKALREADQAVTRLRTQVDALRAKEAALAPAREKIRGLETDLGDWRLLSDATGKDGIPQLRIDAAGPEVSATATEILRVIWGSRFAISIETQTETLDGKAVEDFEIVIHDAAERRTVEDLSGGERVAVHRAISLAASIYCRNRSGIDWETLCLDEADGALDRDNARHYVPMLRKAREIGRFHQIIIISQRAEVIAAADVVVNVSEGVLTVEGAAAREAA